MHHNAYVIDNHVIDTEFRCQIHLDEGGCDGRLEVRKSIFGAYLRACAKAWADTKNAEKWVVIGHYEGETIVLERLAEPEKAEAENATL